MDLLEKQILGFVLQERASGITVQLVLCSGPTGKSRCCYPAIFPSDNRLNAIEIRMYLYDIEAGKLRDKNDISS